MDLIAYAVPFFLAALLVELVADKLRKSRLYRLNDAVNSLSAGILDQTTGYFTKFLPLFFYGLVFEHFALIDMPLAWFDLSPRGIALWAIAIVGWDFCYYWLHRYSHEISVLWAAHAVHHQSEDYNLSTALRQTSSSFLLNWIFFLPMFVIGFPFEVLFAVAAINLIYQFWVHTQIVRRLGVLDRIFSTPSNHRVHHAQNDRYIDKNYGGIFIIWDRMFGTFQAELDEEPVVFGVRKQLANWNPIWANLQVYSYLWQDSVRAERLGDKLRVWFGRTGWRPADVAAAYPRALTDPEHLVRFDPAVPAAVRRYVLLQFVIATALTLVISVLYAQQGAAVVLVPCLQLWALLYTLGLLDEMRPYALRFEALRLLVIVPLGILAFGTQAAWLVPTAAGYILASLIGLILIRKSVLKQQVIDVN